MDKEKFVFQDQYPLIVEHLSPILELSDEKTVRVLRDVASLSGSGDISPLFNATEIQDKVKRFFAESREKINKIKDDSQAYLNAMDLAIIKKNFTSLQYVIVADITAAISTELNTYLEVILSGLQVTSI